MKRVIIENGVSNYAVVTSKFADEGVLFAAGQLKQYLDAATDAVVPYFSDRCEKRGPEICVGENVRGHREDLTMLDEEGFLIKTEGENLYITGKTPRGVIYGVYKFLEIYIRLRHFNREVETYDKVEALTVEDITYWENPAFEYRDSYFRGAFDCDFAVKNRLNSTLAHIPYERGGKRKFYNLHHSFYDILPPEQYFESHPEWYSEIDGERIIKIGHKDTQLCLTNREAIAEAIKNVRKWILARPDCSVFSIAQNDNIHMCTCENCRKMNEEEGSPAGSVLYFVNAIAGALEEEFPHVLFHTFAYKYSAPAPRHIKARDNVIVRLCNIECSWEESVEAQAAADPESPCGGFAKNIADWSKICKHLYIWDYACNFHFYLLPFPNYRVLQENLRYYKKNGVHGVLQQSNFAYGNTSGFADLENYLASRLMWNPEEDLNALIEDYTGACFGNGAPYIRQLLELLQDRVKGHRMTLYYKPDASFITDDLVEEMDSLFKKALAAEPEGDAHARLAREALSVEFLRLTRLALDTPGREEMADALYEKVKAHGITEIFERKELRASFQCLKQVRYCADKTVGNPMWLYYIMK